MKLTIPAEETKTIIAAHVEERGFSVSTHTVLPDGSHEIEVKFAEPAAIDQGAWNLNRHSPYNAAAIGINAAAEALGATTELDLGKKL